MMITGIKETCIYIRDTSLAREFYNEKLGFPIIHDLPGKHIFFRVGGSVLLCFNPEDSKSKKSPPAHYTYGPQHFAFEVEKDQYEDSKKMVEGKGIEITHEITWPSGLKSFYFEDPAGNVLEIVPKGVWEGNN